MVSLVRSEDRKPSKRVFPLLQNLDLDSVTFGQIQGVGDPITIEDMNEQEMYDLVLVNLARLVCAGEWTGLLEAGGGGAGIVLPNIGASSETMYLISNSPIWGSTDATTTQSVGIQNKATAFPFIAPKSGAITALVIQVASGYSSNAYVAIYGTTDDNTPGDLMGYATIDTTSTGQITQTSISATVTLVAGTLYYFSLSIDGGGSSATLQATDNLDVPNIGIGSTITEAAICFYDNAMTSYDVPPATFTASLAASDSRALVAIKY